MKYAFLMDSGAVMYIPSFIKIGPGIHNLMGGGGGIHIHTYTMVTT
jgi:hypothetical protein